MSREKVLQLRLDTKEPAAKRAWHRSRNRHEDGYACLRYCLPTTVPILSRSHASFLREPTMQQCQKLRDG